MYGGSHLVRDCKQYLSMQWHSIKLSIIAEWYKAYYAVISSYLAFLVFNLTWFSIHLYTIIIHSYNNRKTYNIRRTLVGNKIVEHSDVVGASPVGAAPTTSSFST